LSGGLGLLACMSVCARAAAHAAPERACCHRSAAIEAEESGCVAAPAFEMGTEPSVEGCCLLAARASVRAPVPKVFAAPDAPAVRRETPVVAPAAPIEADASPPPPALDRSDTRLRCCVFLI
jgi:hypothetical protein